MARSIKRSDSAVKAAKPAEPHKITLIDQTKPLRHDEAEDDNSSTTEPDTDDLAAAGAGGGGGGEGIGTRRGSRSSRLSKKLTQTSVKEELARRKYAKWKRPPDDVAGSASGDGRVRRMPHRSTENTLSTMDTPTATAATTTTTPRNTKDTNGERESAGLQDTDLSSIRTTSSETAAAAAEAAAAVPTDTPAAPARNDSRSSNRPTSAIDILYENQRGYFFCGVPFFSGNSLLNFDPPAWVTASGGPSPVDVQTAQVPDPSWEWAWPSWYVDMANDVDEEGWQYSFAFFKGLAWHGTHPWFHSFVRRRRWIRKRVRRREMLRQQKQKQKQKHEQDVFRGQESTGAAGSANGPAMAESTDASAYSGKPVKQLGDEETASKARKKQGHSPYKRASVNDDDGESNEEEDDDDIDGTEIRNVNVLMQRLRYAAVDRERIGAVKSFLRDGDEAAVAHLAEHINHIMSLFIFHSSRRQLLHLLRREHKQASSKDAAVVSSGSKAAKSPPPQQRLASAPAQRQTRTSPPSETSRKKSNGIGTDIASTNNDYNNTDNSTSPPTSPLPPLSTPPLRSESLQKAIAAASAYIQYREYWSDAVRTKNNDNDNDASLSASMSASGSTSGSGSGSGYEPGSGSGYANAKADTDGRDNIDGNWAGTGTRTGNVSGARLAGGSGSKNGRGTGRGTETGFESSHAESSSSAYATASGGPLHGSSIDNSVGRSSVGRSSSSRNSNGTDRPAATTTAAAADVDADAAATADADGQSGTGVAHGGNTNVVRGDDSGVGAAGGADRKDVWKDVKEC